MGVVERLYCGTTTYPITAIEVRHASTTAGTKPFYDIVIRSSLLLISSNLSVEAAQ